MSIWKKLLKTNNAFKIFAKWIFIITKQVDEKHIMYDILKENLNYDDILINEASKPIIQYDIKIKTKQTNFKKELERKTELIYMSLLKFKGLLKYINFQGLSSDDIRKISYYIKHAQYKKGEYIFRQFDKSDALYGVIRGKVVIREIVWTDLYKKFRIDSLTGANDDEFHCLDTVPINNFLSDCEEEYEEDENEYNLNNSNEENDEDKSENINNNITNNEQLEIKTNKNNNLNNSKSFENDEPINELNDSELDKKEIEQNILNSNIQTTTENKKKKLIKKIVKAIPFHQTPDGPLINDKLYDFIKNFEIEKFALSDGMCFGEWGLIYDIRRTTSIYALEDTDLFYLEKEPFNKILIQKFLKSDNDKVNFIMNRITLFKKEIKMRHILTKVIPLFFDKNSIVYTPYDKPEDLYLLYQGECAIVNLEKHTCKEDFYMNISKLKLLTILTQGGIAGFESCEKNKKTFDNCLIVTKDFTVILKLNVKYFEGFYRDFKDSIIPLIKKQNDFVKKLNKFKKKFKEKYDIKNIVSKKYILSKKISSVIKGQKKISLKNNFKPNKLELNIKNVREILSPRQRNEKKYHTKKYSVINPFLSTNNNFNTITTTISEHKFGNFSNSNLNKNFSDYETKSQEKIKSLKNNYFFKTNNELVFRNIHTARNFSGKIKKFYYGSPNKINFINNNNFKNLTLDNNIIQTAKMSRNKKKLNYYDSGKFNLPFLTEI